MNLPSSQPVGTPPGSYRQLPGGDSAHFVISLMHYNHKTLEEQNDVPIEECFNYLAKEGVTWINITGQHDLAVMEKLSKVFGLHPLLLEDIASAGERPKIDAFADQIFIILRLLDFDKDKREVRDHQVSIILGKNFVISFFHKESGVIEPIKERIRSSNTRIRTLGSDYLTYALIDTIVDRYFVIIKNVDDKLDNLEEELMHNASKKTLQKIQRVKREMAILRRAVWPTREVVSQFMRTESPLVKKDAHFYIRDVYDHTIQAIEAIEGFRDIAGGMLEIYLSTISQRLNEVMKVLTVVATVFAPITFLTGVYGMNFAFMPGINHPWGFFGAALAMLCVSGSMLIYFRVKRWI